MSELNSSISNGEQGRLRIALVVHDYNRRMGHSRYVAELAERFARHHEVHVFCGQADEPVPNGIRFHYIPAWKWKSLTYILSFILPATFAVGNGFDIIHAQGLSGFRQDVTTAHMCQEAWFTEKEHSVGSLTWFERVTRIILGTLERVTYLDRVSPQVIAISEINRAAIRQYYSRDRHVSLVYHGTDLDRFSPALRPIFRQSVRRDLGFSDEAVVGLYVGDLRKGALSVLKALAHVPALRMVFVAHGRSDAWQMRARELNVADRAIFCAGTNAVEQYYAAADLLVFPTFHDAFGLVVTEAMASGLPVIVSCNAGAAELVEDGLDGFLLRNSNDTTELVAALTPLVADSQFRTRVGAAARNKISTFTWDRTAAETLAVYRELLSRRNGRRTEKRSCR